MHHGLVYKEWLSSLDAETAGARTSRIATSARQYNAAWVIHDFMFGLHNYSKLSPHKMSKTSGCSYY